MRSHKLKFTFGARRPIYRFALALCSERETINHNRSRIVNASIYRFVRNSVVLIKLQNTSSNASLRLFNF